MPGGPPRLHVVGDVFIPNPGVEVTLVMREPQGINPSDLLMILHRHQKPGMWPQVTACAQVEFTRVLPSGSVEYRTVTVHGDGGAEIAQIPVEIVS